MLWSGHEVRVWSDWLVIHPCEAEQASPGNLSQSINYHPHSCIQTVMSVVLYSDLDHARGRFCFICRMGYKNCTCDCGWISTEQVCDWLTQVGIMRDYIMMPCGELSDTAHWWGVGFTIAKLVMTGTAGNCVTNSDVNGHENKNGIFMLFCLWNSDTTGHRLNCLDQRKSKFCEKYFVNEKFVRNNHKFSACFTIIFVPHTHIDPSLALPHTLTVTILINW